MLTTGAVYPLLYLLPTAPFELDPPVFGAIVFGLAGIGLAGLFVVPDAIIAAIADHDGRMTGNHREAMYYGVNGFVAKINFGVSATVGAALLQILGPPLGLQVTGPVGGAAALLGAWLFRRYPEAVVERSVPSGKERADLLWPSGAVPRPPASRGP